MAWEVNLHTAFKKTLSQVTFTTYWTNARQSKKFKSSDVSTILAPVSLLISCNNGLAFPLKESTIGFNAVSFGDIQENLSAVTMVAVLMSSIFSD